MIEQLYLKFLASDGVTTDTRANLNNKIFFALKGVNFNGNKFAEQALENGALAVVIDQPEFNKTNEAYFLVEDVLVTLQNLSAHHRQQFNIPVIGITGSNGKTTTKELTNLLISTQFNCFATQGNFNNHIGVPLSLLSINNETKVAIIEMGANHVGEIALYCQWVKPTHGLISNIGNAHLEGFGSFENVIRAKSELYNELMENKKIIFYNQEDALLTSLLEKYDYKISYGKTENVDTQVILTKAFPTLSVQFEDEVYDTNLFGEYNFDNLSAALAIASYFDISKENIRLALSHFVPKNNRSEIRQLRSNLVILDAYNANPTSVQAAIKSFAKLNVSNKIVIIGDMFELGMQSHKLHQDIVNYIDSYFFEKAIFVGKEFAQCRSKKDSLFIQSTNEAKTWFEENNFENQTILIKGSRGMKLERLLN